MAGPSSIEWTDCTWNPVRGCTRLSGGCRNCYAEGVAARFSGPGQPYEGLAEFVTRSDGRREARWTGKLTWDHDLTAPLRWRKPRRIFVNSMSDLFHEAVPDEAIDRVFAVMALAQQHTFQILTKRPARMREYMDAFVAGRRSVCHEALKFYAVGAERAAEAMGGGYGVRPLPNVWLGVSAEDQATADARRDDLAALAAAGWTTFLSYEPALGPVDWTGWEFLRLAIAGGESGPRARPMHPDWPRALRDQCAAAGTAFFMKQLSGPKGRAIKDIDAFPVGLQIREFPHAAR